MYILVWEASPETEARATAYSEFEATCLAILKMPALSIPHHVIEMRTKVFDPGSFELKQFAMGDFLERYGTLLTSYSLHLLAEELRDDP